MNAQTRGMEHECPECGARLLPVSDDHYGIFTIEEHDREFVIRHCERCGALLIGVIPLPVGVK